MHLSTHSDYALRVMMYLGAHPGRRATIPELAEAYGISRTHLTKVVHRLGTLGFIETARGKNGGVWLSRPPAAIPLGGLVRAIGERFNLVECFTEDGACPIHGPCRLEGVLCQALAAFQRELDRRTVADLLGDGRALSAALARPALPALPAKRRARSARR